MRKRLVSMLLASAMVLSMGVSSLGAEETKEAETKAAEETVAVEETEAAEEVKVDYSKYAPGVTVEADKESPTGYKATFVYKQQDSYEGLEGEIVKVRMYSDVMMLFDPEEGTGVKNYTPDAQSATNGPNATAIAPSEYRDGLFTAGGSGPVALYVEMEKLENGLWGTQVILPSGAFVYNFEVTDEKGNVKSRLDDPSNPTFVNEAAGTRSLSSKVYVPYAAAQGKGEFMGRSYADRSVELPRKASAVGKVDFVAYESAAGSLRGLSVYLPYGYDADREEPYKVLYLSHGMSSDMTGNELRWMNEGDVQNIMDNLVAEGKAEPFVVVTMDNQFIDGKWWNYDAIWAETELILAYVEENYNVCKEPEGRAYAGLSMGGITTSNMLLNHPELFSYFGIWSAATTEIPDEELVKAQAGRANLMFAGGVWDFGLESVQTLQGKLKDLGLEGECLVVPGAHDWETWQLIYAYAAENFFFKEAADYTGYEPGVTVEADAASATGYTATFVYKEQESYDGLEGEIVKVRMYSDCMLMFNPADSTEDKDYANAPYTIAKGTIGNLYADGMFPAGGSGDTALYVTMDKIGDKLWGCKVALPSGAYVYNFEVTDEKGNVKSRLDDPSNPTFVNEAAGTRSLSSKVYIPYDEKQGTGEFLGMELADRSVELPREDEKVGKVDFNAYTSVAGSTRGYCVYLPYGYDATREEPYKVLYLSHGASSDMSGNELRWMNEGDVQNIMDNLVADGKCEPFVVVTMDNQFIDGARWSYDAIWGEHQLIMADVEAKYNVSKEREGRAYAGLSMGGITTSNMLMNHPELFSYYGIWSAANTTIPDEALVKAQAGSVKLLYAGGVWDFGLSSVKTLQGKLAELGLEGDLLVVPGAHDWETWQLIYAYAATNFFFK